jgi:hypothetical protein
MQLFDRRVTIVVIVTMAAACNVNQDTDELTGFAKILPSAGSIPEAWQLFDRSIASELVPGGDRITVSLDHTTQLRAFKVFGPAPYHIHVRGPGSASLGFESLDMSTLSPGWHIVASSAPVSTSEGELRFSPTGAGGGVRELELWAQDDRPPSANRVDLTARELSAGFESAAAESTTDRLSAGDCTGFAVAIPRPPTLFRRAYLIYDASGLFRSFGPVRSPRSAAHELCAIEHGQAIVGIEIPIARLEGKWKVSQNRSPEDRAGVVAGLQRRSDPIQHALAELVRERS